MRLTLAVLAALLVFAAPARAAGPQVGIADDRILLAGGADADAAVKEWQELGIQTVRIYALWSRIAPNSPSGENDYAQLDHAVDRVVQAGGKAIPPLTRAGALWGSRRGGRGGAPP